jgi:uncharacterized membrane protein
MIREFFYKYYIDPIRYGGAYTPVDTLTYALVLILAVYLIYRWFKRTNLPVDARLVLATLPYVVLGGLLRVVEDTGVITSWPKYLLITPLIFFTVFLIAVCALIGARLLEGRGVVRDFIPYYAGFGTVASIAVAGYLTSFGVASGTFAVAVLAIILAMAVFATLLVWSAMVYLLQWNYARDPLYEVLIFGHMLDASATSYGIDLHPLTYVEQHVVGSGLIEWTGTAFVMFPLKLLVLFPGVYILERFRSEGSPALWHLIVLAMIVVGLSPGIRDMVRMVLFV